MLDGAVAVYDGVAGVEPQTETVWRQADKYSVPRMCFVNKLDRTGADFFRCVDDDAERLNSNALVLQLPIGNESDFIGVVDLVEMRALTWRGETKLGEDYAVEEIPAELADQAAEYREKLIEQLADVDDSIAEAYLEGDELDVADASRPRSAAPRWPTCVNPVLTGSAFKNKGVQPMLDAVVDYLPSPLDVDHVTGTLQDGETVGRAQGRRVRAAGRAGVQDRHRQAPRQADLRAHLLRRHGERRAGPELHQGPQGADRQDLPDAREQA